MKIGDKIDGYICVGLSDEPPVWATVEDVEKVAFEYMESLPGHWEFIYDEDNE